LFERANVHISYVFAQLSADVLVWVLLNFFERWSVPF